MPVLFICAQHVQIKRHAPLCDPSADANWSPIEVSTAASLTALWFCTTRSADTGSAAKFIRFLVTTALQRKFSMRRIVARLIVSTVYWLCMPFHFGFLRTSRIAIAPCPSKSRP